jgi:hypothetical protein
MIRSAILRTPTDHLSSHSGIRAVSSIPRARYYDLASGRFISTDPSGFSGGLNFYAYVDNSPLSRTDPFGLRPLTDEQCRELREVLELEKEYGTFVAAHFANLDLSGTKFYYTISTVTVGIHINLLKQHTVL